jgi:hypothetical protein
MDSMISSQMEANAGGASNKAAGMEFVSGQMDIALQSFQSVAKVLAVEKPELLPLLKKVVEGGMILMQEIQALMPQGGPQAPGYPNQTSQETPESAAGSISMS